MKGRFYPMKIQALQVGPIGTNCYLLCDETQGVCAVIDPGGDPDRIISAVEYTGCTPEAILLTHGHYDHTGGVVGLLEKFPALPVYLHRADFDMDDPYLFPLKGQLNGLPAARFYGEGDHLSVGGLDVEVLHTPGHSEGSVTLRCGDVLFCGDTLFSGSCGRTDFPGGSMEKMMASLSRLGQLEGDFTVCPGHMEPSTLERERQYNPFLLQALGEVR